MKKSKFKIPLYYLSGEIRSIEEGVIERKGDTEITQKVISENKKKFFGNFKNVTYNDLYNYRNFLNSEIEKLNKKNNI